MRSSKYRIFDIRERYNFYIRKLSLDKHLPKSENEILFAKSKRFDYLLVYSISPCMQLFKCNYASNQRFAFENPSSQLIWFCTNILKYSSYMHDWYLINCHGWIWYIPISVKYVSIFNWYIQLNLVQHSNFSRTFEMCKWMCKNCKMYGDNKTDRHVMSDNLHSIFPILISKLISFSFTRFD